MNADVAGAIDGQARLAFLGREADQREGQPLFSLGEKFLNAPSIHQILQSRLLAVRAVAIFAEDANHGGGDGHRLLGPQQQAAILGELLVARDAAKQYAKIDAGGNARPSPTRVATKPMSLVSATTLMAPPLSKATLNLRGKPVHVARVQNVVVKRIGKRRHIVEFRWVKAGDGRGGDVADVVRAGTARSQTERLYLVENAHDIFWLELANLQVGASRDIGAARAPLRSHLRQAAHLVRGEDTAGNAQPQHEGVLRRSDIEETMELEAEKIVGGRARDSRRHAQRACPRCRGDFAHASRVLPCRDRRAGVP